MRHQPEQESILGHFLLVGLDLEVYLDRLLRTTTKKRLSTFLVKKVHPRQNTRYAYGFNLLVLFCVCHLTVQHLCTSNFFSVTSALCDVDSRPM